MFHYLSQRNLWILLLANAPALGARISQHEGQLGDSSQLSEGHPSLFGSAREQQYHFDDYKNAGRVAAQLANDRGATRLNLKKMSCTFGNRLDSITTHFVSACRTDGKEVAVKHGGSGGDTTRELEAGENCINRLAGYLCSGSKYKGQLCLIKYWTKEGRRKQDRGQNPDPKDIMVCGNSAGTPHDNNPITWQSPSQSCLRFAWGYASNEILSLGFYDGPYNRQGINCDKQS